MSVINCSCCNGPAEPHKIVNCCVCNKPYKIDCVNISSGEARKIHSKSGLTWTCKNCAQLGNDINSLKKIIIALQNDINELKSKMLTPDATNSQANLLDVEKIVQEVADREKRKFNIVVFGLKEDKDLKTNNDQLNADKVILPKILSAVGFNENDLNFMRLGKFDSSKQERCRPVKVFLSSTGNVIDILRNSFKLKLIPDYSNISISSDRTPMQLQAYKAVKNELSNRLANGELNLKIKYKNGIPGIVSNLN